MQNDTPKTIVQLSQWMKDNCYQPNSYSLHGETFNDTCGITLHNGKYAWYYTERGIHDYLKYFDTEEEIVAYAFSEIQKFRKIFLPAPTT